MNNEARFRKLLSKAEKVTRKYIDDASANGNLESLLWRTIDKEIKQMRIYSENDRIPTVAEKNSNQLSRLLRYSFPQQTDRPRAIQSLFELTDAYKRLGLPKDATQADVLEHLLFGGK